MKVNLYLNYRGKTFILRDLEFDGDDGLGDETHCPFPTYAQEMNDNYITEHFYENVKVTEVERIQEPPDLMKSLRQAMEEKRNAPTES